MFVLSNFHDPSSVGQVSHRSGHGQQKRVRVPLMVEDYQTNNQLIQDQLGNKNADASRSGHASVVHILQDPFGIVNYGRYQNEAANQKVTFAGNSELSD